MPRRTCCVERPPCRSVKLGRLRNDQRAHGVNTGPAGVVTSGRISSTETRGRLTVIIRTYPERPSARESALQKQKPRQPLSPSHPARGDRCECLCRTARAIATGQSSIRRHYYISPWSRPFSQWVSACLLGGHSVDVSRGTHDG